MTSLTEFLFPAPARRRASSILGWWEKRRLAYNLIVGGAGLASLAGATVISLLPPFPTPLGMIPWQPVVAFGVLANFFYCLGPTVEILVNQIWKRGVLPVGPALFRMGLTFSVGLAFLPVMVAALAYVIRTLAVLVGFGM